MPTSFSSQAERWMTYRASVRLLSPKVCLSLQLYDSSIRIVWQRPPPGSTWRNGRSLHVDIDISRTPASSPCRIMRRMRIIPAVRPTTEHRFFPVVWEGIVSIPRSQQNEESLIRRRTIAREFFQDTLLLGCPFTQETELETILSILRIRYGNFVLPIGLGLHTEKWPLP